MVVRVSLYMRLKMKIIKFEHDIDVDEYYLYSDWLWEQLADLACQGDHFAITDNLICFQDSKYDENTYSSFSLIELSDPSVFMAL